MFKVCGSIDLSIDDLKTCIKGSQLLSANLSYERSLKGKSAVAVDESYFIRYAIYQAIDQLENQTKFDIN